MKKIIFLCDWGHSSVELFNLYKYQTPNHDGIWGELQATIDPKEADYFIIMDGLPENAPAHSIPDDKKIYLQREPSEVVKKHQFQKDNALFKADYDTHYHVSTWRIKVPFKELESINFPKKTKTISTVMSGKKNTKGQKRRIKTLINLYKKYPQIDIYGKSLDKYKLGAAYKGALNYNDYCKFKGLINYKYSLAFENSIHANYFTEKIIDCFLTWTKPIYWGCPNIDTFFPEDSFINIDIFKKDAVDIIIEEINKPVNYEAMKKARDLVLYKYNIWPSIEKIINQN